MSPKVTGWWEQSLAIALTRNHAQRIPLPVRQLPHLRRTPYAVAGGSAHQPAARLGSLFGSDRSTVTVRLEWKLPACARRVRHSDFMSRICTPGLCRALRQGEVEPRLLYGEPGFRPSLRVV